MPKRTIKIFLFPTPEQVEDDFKNLYGGTDANWNWLRKRLEKIDPDDLKRLCEKLSLLDLVKLGPCWVFGRLRIENEDDWKNGLEEGLLMVEAVVHEDFATAYYEHRRAGVPESEQDV